MGSTVRGGDGNVSFNSGSRVNRMDNDAGTKKGGMMTRDTHLKSFVIYLTGSQRTGSLAAAS